ncbi:unnamed protein product [marine sediment metagenome]|uniref:Uncharacterized protein n=1 Tax=marine sediment metagenome TaxID=412755 RepID=X0S7E1_9ZZZZ
MPNKQTHVTIGTLAGGGLAAYRAREQEPLNMLLEAIGGGIGGYIGGRLPDVIEPASWPGHRQLAHSVIAGGAVGFSVYELLGKWEKWCRSKAELYNQRRTTEGANVLKDILFTLLEIILRVAAGFLSGLGTSYLSHLALDWRTPAGLPILM